jgi:hypothetical protein
MIPHLRYQYHCQSLAITSYMYKYTTLVTSSGFVYVKQEVFSNSIVRMLIVIPWNSLEYM